MVIQSVPLRTMSGELGFHCGMIPKRSLNLFGLPHGDGAGGLGGGAAVPVVQKRVKVETEIGRLRARHAATNRHMQALVDNSRRHLMLQPDVLFVARIADGERLRLHVNLRIPFGEDDLIGVDHLASPIQANRRATALATHAKDLAGEVIDCEPDAVVLRNRITLRIGFQ